MIIVDKALEKRQADHNPIRVGMIGAGFMGRGIALQICNYVPGMELVAISNRNIDAARRAYTEAGIDQVREVTTVSQLEETIAQNQYAVTEDALLLCQADGIDAIIEVTGAVEFGAQVVLIAIEHG
ncbi:MAG: NAD(P)-dependent oxidoreductase, partial [Anaerolineae bacterium]|nr:NAD(P)-dependent oxidoreductase [Anaerolineae bacterium]